MLQAIHPTRVPAVLDEEAGADAPPKPADRATSAGIEAAVDALAARLAATAVERDARGGHAADERALIAASGLLALTVPTAFGGLGADMPQFQRSVRRLAQADSALSHVFAFHHLQLHSVLLWGTAPQQRRWLADTVRDDLWWGNALNPLDTRTRAESTAAGWRIDGRKSFCSGAIGSDRLLVSAWHTPKRKGAADALLVAVVPTERAGLTLHDDWDAFGQKQTDSGTVAFDRLELDADEVLVAPTGAAATPRATLRTLVSQLVMANLYVGLALGAFDAARRYTREEARPWLASGVEASTDDPYVQHRYGELWLLVRPAVALADAAARQLQHALDLGDALDARTRGEAAIAVSEAKLLAHRASLEVGAQMFELMGARATSRRFGFDRYWRNARVHTLHDPADYKLRDLGRWLLDGRVPEPTSYS